MYSKKITFRLFFIINFFIIITTSFTSCNDDDDIIIINDDNDVDTSTTCNDPADFIFVEENNFINIEFENSVFNNDWELINSSNNVTGDGYMVWTGSQFLREPSNDLTTFTIRIQNPGTYRFIWRSAVTIGNNGSDHNDTWLRFSDADDYFGERNNGSIVFPNDTGRTPNPNGASIDGWFKVYRSGNDLDFKWQSSTSDNDAHNIFVRFDTSGDYTMEISARSSGHAIDRFILFQETDYTMQEAISEENSLSTIMCE